MRARIGFPLGAYRAKKVSGDSGRRVFAASESVGAKTRAGRTRAGFSSDHILGGGLCRLYFTAALPKHRLLGGRAHARYYARNTFHTNNSLCTRCRVTPPRPLNSSAVALAHYVTRSQNCSSDYANHGDPRRVKHGKTR